MVLQSLLDTLTPPTPGGTWVMTSLVLSFLSHPQLYSQQDSPPLGLILSLCRSSQSDPARPWASPFQTGPFCSSHLLIGSPEEPLRNGVSSCPCLPPRLGHSMALSVLVYC